MGSAVDALANMSDTAAPAPGTDTPPQKSSGKSAVEELADAPDNPPPTQTLRQQVMGQPFIDEVRGTFSRENAGKSLNLGASAAGVAGALKGAVPIAAKGLQTAEKGVAAFKTAYPNLTALAGKFGAPLTAVGLLELAERYIRGKK